MVTPAGAAADRQAAGPSRGGPLAGTRIIEIGAIGPVPMCAMLLADLGATVLRIKRPVNPGLGLHRPTRFDLVLRNRHVIALDLKSAAAVDLVLDC